MKSEQVLRHTKRGGISISVERPVLKDQFHADGEQSRESSSEGQGWGDNV
jgi:hypothetical protein